MSSLAKYSLTATLTFLTSPTLGLDLTLIRPPTPMRMRELCHFIDTLPFNQLEIGQAMASSGRKDSLPLKYVLSAIAATCAETGNVLILQLSFVFIPINSFCFVAIYSNIPYRHHQDQVTAAGRETGSN